MRNKSITLLTVAVVLLLLPASVAFSQEISKGMSFGEVLSSKKWGAPKEKVLYETTRIEKWLYDESRSVSFLEGKVNSWEFASLAISRKDDGHENIKDLKEKITTKKAPLQPSLPGSEQLKDESVKSDVTKGKLEETNQKVTVSSFLGDVEKEGSSKEAPSAKPPRGRGKRR